MLLQLVVGIHDEAALVAFVVLPHAVRVLLRRVHLRQTCGCRRLVELLVFLVLILDQLTAHRVGLLVLRLLLLHARASALVSLCLEEVVLGHLLLQLKLLLLLAQDFIGLSSLGVQLHLQLLHILRGRVAGVDVLWAGTLPDNSVSGNFVVEPDVLGRFDFVNAVLGRPLLIGTGIVQILLLG